MKIRPLGAELFHVDS